MKKLILVLFLSVSLVCLSQTTAPTGSATTPQTATQMAVPGPPQVVPSDVTLPGSGPPVGAALSNINDSRNGGIVQAYNPVAVVEHPVVENTAESGAGLTSGEGAQIPFNTGLQNFAGSATVSQPSGFSLGDIARQYRNQAHPAPRTFTNDSISQLRGGQSLPQGREMSQAPQRDAQREMAMAAAIPPMSAAGLPQSDTAQSSQIDQKKRTSSTAQNAGTADAAPAGQNANNRDNLPASGSELPLLALLGIVIAGGGVLYRFRR